MTTTCSLLRRRPVPARLGSVVAVCALALGTQSVFAQGQPTPPATGDDAPVVLEELVVNTVRGALISGQEIKQNAPELVDAIVAQDIGKLPDNTVADALQRVPGIQVSRGAGEANTVVIRGLPNLETTLNGYEVFTGTGRGVALQDIPAEMLAGVDAYKSVGPDKIEGGVAGLIDVRLRRPLDLKAGLTQSFNVRGVYGDQSGKTSYSASYLISNRWKSGAGEFGALLDLSYARRKYQDQVLDNYVHFGANGETFDIATDSTGTPGYYADNFGWQIIPGDRTRPAAALSLQWKTNSGIEFYSDTLLTGYRNTHSVDFFIGIPSWGGFRTNVVLYPAGNGGWTNDGNHDGSPDRFVQSFVAHDTVTLTSTQAFHDTTDTIQGAFGAKWDNERVKINSEVSYNISTVNTKGVILDTAITSPTQTLGITYNDGAALSVDASGVDYANGNNYWLTQFYDQWSRAYSDQYAIKTDATVRLESGPFQSMQFGVRYAARSVNYHSDDTGGTFIWHAAAASSVPGIGKITSTEPFVSAGQFNIREFWSPDAGWLLMEANTNQLRQIFGRPQGTRPPDQSRTFTDDEKSFAAYALANYSVKLGDMPLDGVIGARFADTHQTLGGYQRPTVFNPATGVTSQASYYLPTSNDRAQWNVLPTLNGRIKLNENLLLRYSVTKTITRPNFANLNPALTLTSSTQTLPGQGSGGNPDLTPIESTNYDASLEYYFSKSSLASIAGFYRSIDGYVQSYATEETIGGLFYTVTRPRNTHNGYLEGIETSYQQFFDNLVKGLGVQANFTYIKGETESPLTGEKQTIAQVSKENYNLILIYEPGKFSSRLAYNWRGRYIESFNQSGLQPTTVWVQPRGQLDFSASYAISEKFTLTFDATNLTGTKYHDNFGNLPMFSRDVRNYDRTYEVGLRARF